MNTPIVSRSDLHLLRLRRASARLRKKLAAATVVPAQKVPAELVTMNSKVTYRDAMGAAKSVKLVYPSQADGVGCVSVMSPLGTALLGAAVGQELDVDIPRRGPPGPSRGGCDFTARTRDAKAAFGGERCLFLLARLPG
jgi:regulator of nucleoside diphosphate kinase